MDRFGCLIQALLIIVALSTTGWNRSRQYSSRLFERRAIPWLIQPIYLSFHCIPPYSFEVQRKLTFILDHAHKIPCSACCFKSLGKISLVLYTGVIARGIVQPRLSFGHVPASALAIVDRRSMRSFSRTTTHPLCAGYTGQKAVARDCL